MLLTGSALEVTFHLLGPSYSALDHEGEWGKYFMSDLPLCTFDLQLLKGYNYIVNYSINAMKLQDIPGKNRGHSREVQGEYSRNNRIRGENKGKGKGIQENTGGKEDKHNFSLQNSGYGTRNRRILGYPGCFVREML